MVDVRGDRAGSEEPVELVSIQVVGQGLRQRSGVEGVPQSRPDPEGGPPRRAYFGSKHGWIDTPLLKRADLVTKRAGPIIIEEYDATCLIPPDAAAALDASGNVVIEIG